MLGSKRHTQQMVIAEADGKAAGLLHYSSFGSCDGANITDAEDQAILEDLRTQTLLPHLTRVQNLLQYIRLSWCSMLELLLLA